MVIEGEGLSDVGVVTCGGGGETDFDDGSINCNNINDALIAATHVNKDET